MRSEHSNFKVVCAGDKAEIFLYDVIGADFFGGISAKRFADELRGAKGAKTIDVRINSPGGDVFDGFSIYTLLKSHQAKVNVYVDGLAASIASVIAMAGDEIEISENGFVMIHDPWSFSVGNAAELRKQADLLDNIRNSIVDTYVARTGGESEAIQDMMAAETWLNSSDAISNGFADRVGSESAIAASVRPELFKFRNLPASLLGTEAPEPQKPTLESVMAAIDERRRQYREAS